MKTLYAQNLLVLTLAVGVLLAQTATAEITLQGVKRSFTVRTK